MDNLENQISQVLNDPERMAQIMSLAQSLSGALPGLGGGQEPEKSGDNNPAPPAFDASALAGLMQQATAGGQREKALFEALKPFVSPERRDKIDRALQISRFSRMASLALQNLNKKP